jgi:hypothetical protein
LFYILWPTQFFVLSSKFVTNAFCDKLNFVTNWILWQTAFCDKLHFVTNWILWQTEFCDKLHFVTNWILWQTEFCDKLNFVTNCILWQTEFSVVSRLRRMVTNIGRSHVSRYPRSQSMPVRGLCSGMTLGKSNLFYPKWDKWRMRFYCFCLFRLLNSRGHTVTMIQSIICLNRFSSEYSIQKSFFIRLKVL